MRLDLYVKDVNDVSSVDNTFMSISDSGGWDVLDASEATRSVVLDLNSGSHSSVGTVYGWYNVEDNLGIAIGTTIEEAIGGAGDDTLIGNSENNSMSILSKAKSTLKSSIWNDVFRK